jgi:hypothetical protein
MRLHVQSKPQIQFSISVLYMACQHSVAFTRAAESSINHSFFCATESANGLPHSPQKREGPFWPIMRAAPHSAQNLSAAAAGPEGADAWL